MKKKLVALLTAVAVLPATLLAGTSPAAAANNIQGVDEWIYPDTSITGLNETHLYVCDAGTELNMPQDIQGATTGLNQFLQDNNCQVETDEATYRFNYVTEHKTLLGISSRAYRFEESVSADLRKNFRFQEETFNMAFRNRNNFTTSSTKCPENMFLPGYHYTYKTDMPATSYPYMSQGSLIISMFVVNLNDVPTPAAECLASKNDTYVLLFWSNNEPNYYCIAGKCSGAEVVPLPQQDLGFAWLYYRLYKPSTPVPETPKKSVVTHKTTSKVLKRKSRKAKTVQVRFRATCKTTLRTSCAPKLGSYKEVKVRNLSTRKTYTLAQHAVKRSPDYGRVKVTLRKGKNKLRIIAPRHKTQTVTLIRR